MKKILSLIIVALMPLFVFSQEHMDFRGVPLDGDLNSFIGKMKELGYTLNKLDGDVAIMKGKFTGEDVDLYISATPKTKTVCKVNLYFSEKSSWNSLKSQYEEYKELFSKKYGENKKSYEFFSKPYYEGDGYELQAVRKEKCTYSTFYDTPRGYIAVQISKFECLLVGYEDKINIELRSTEKDSKNLNEI